MVTKREGSWKELTSQTASDAPLGLLAEVRLLNDDHTPMQFVVQVLQGVFDKDPETATRIMMEVHNVGYGICGIYPSDIAEAKMARAINFAQQHKHPLQCVLVRSVSVLQNGD